MKLYQWVALGSLIGLLCGMTRTIKGHRDAINDLRARVERLENPTKL